MGSLIWRFAALHFCAGASSLRFAIEAHGSKKNVKQGAPHAAPSEYRTRAPVPGGTKCERTLRKKEEKNKILRSTCGKCSF